jgi:hypothetical protein
MYGTTCDMPDAISFGSVSWPSYLKGQRLTRLNDAVNHCKYWTVEAGVPDMDEVEEERHEWVSLAMFAWERSKDPSVLGVLWLPAERNLCDVRVRYQGLLGGAVLPISGKRVTVGVRQHVIQILHRRIQPCFVVLLAVF